MTVQGKPAVGDTFVANGSNPLRVELSVGEQDRQRIKGAGVISIQKWNPDKDSGVIMESRGFDSFESQSTSLTLAVTLNLKAVLKPGQYMVVIMLTQAHDPTTPSLTAPLRRE